MPRSVLLECIEVASHAPMGGNIEANRWMIIDDPDLISQVARLYREVGYVYLDTQLANTDDPRQQKVHDSARYLCDHLHEVLALVLSLRLGRVSADSAGEVAAFLRLGSSGRMELSARGSRPRHRILRGRRSPMLAKPRCESCSISPTASAKWRFSRSATTRVRSSSPRPGGRLPKSPT